MKIFHSRVSKCFYLTFDKGQIKCKNTSILECILASNLGP